MEIRFFPLEFKYEIKEGQPYIYMYGKLEDNTKLCVIQKHQPYFYAQVHQIHKQQLEKRLKGIEIETKSGKAKVTSWEEVKKELLGKTKTFWKIYTNFPQAVPLISKELSSWGIECYERDIPFVHRYLRDKKIAPMTLVEAKGEFIKEKNTRVPIFLAEEIKQFSRGAIKQLKTLAIDIETYSPERATVNPEKNPILMIAFYGMDEEGKEFKKVLTWKRFKTRLDYLETVTDEIELLMRFKQIILDYQADIITGYFSDGFDFPYIKTRADKYKLKMDLGLDYSELDTGKKTDFREGKAKITGMLHLDVFKFIRNIFGKNLKTESYSLDAVSKELLGNKKHDVKISELAQAWDNNSEELEDFCKYNLQDAHLTLRLCQKLMFDMIEFTKIVNLPLFDVIRMRFSKLVESYIMKRAIEYNVLAPNRPGRNEIDQRMEETFQGAFVYEPTPGLYEDIIVFDFRSLYPTIITAHNVGPEGLCCGCCDEENRDKVPEEEKYWFCTRKKAFLPKVLERLILRRVDLKRLIKETKEKSEETNILEARSYALKTLANSFYGYLGFFGARWYCLECAQATTAFARDYIKRAIKKAEEKGFQVIYADTDSCFLLLGDKIKDGAMEFMNEVNFNLPGHMELEFEGHYPKGIFVALKGKEGGAKKKYALLAENGEMKITGFETVRRNWSPIAKEVQEEVLHLVLEDRKEEALVYVKDIVKELKKGEIDLNKLIIKTQITKDLASYSSIGPHVAVALRLLEQGVKVSPGMVVEYVIAKGSGLIREKAKLLEEVKPGEYDADYYLYNQIIPAVSSIFAVLGINEEDLYRDSSQTGLGKFF
jgi:DNA polymerase elongation subunit (family B)